MKLELVKETNPILFQPTQKWDFDNPPYDAVELAHAMYDLMNEKGGIGMAAPQVGIPYSVIVLRSEPKLACFNPRIVSSSQQVVEMEEGCLSFPGLGIKIFRPDEVRVRFAGPNGRVETHQFKGLTARVFQHEFDHLQGVCFTSKVSKLRLDMFMRKRKKLAKKIDRGQVVLESDTAMDALLKEFGTMNMRYDPNSTAVNPYV